MEKRYDHTKFEQKARDLWEKEKLYAFDKNSQKQTYSIDTPPPTVSGTLHIGHIFSYTHTDIIARYKRMQNYNVFYPMGFDDNGLPTERYVEKKHKTKAHMLKRSDFINLCLKESVEIEKVFENLWKQMGLSVDWSQIYSTISDNVRKISQYSFIELYNKNLVYRKEEPSLYCTTCRTSVAQAELDNKDVTTTFNDLEFQTEDGQKLIIATTRPELLPACVAIFYHPNDKRYAQLAGKYALTPVFKNKVKILPDEKVDPEKGTGLVMCCTFGDQTDIYWYKTHKLPFIHLVGFDGKWTEAGGPLAGMRVHEARKVILELLEKEHKLISQKAISHNVNVHERCKQEIEYLVLSQWFIKILENKDKFLELAEKIRWKPAFMKARYRDWVENLSWDWCVSRQRFFGIPFPVWHCNDCKHVMLAETNNLPIDPQEQSYPNTKCPKCNSSDLTGDTDIMDTWNTSSLTPQINLNWPEQSAQKSNTGTNLTLPMSLRPQAHDIIRTWAFDTIVKAYYHHNQIPWNDIMISGHVLSGKEKISKSKGNQKMAPETLLNTYPADVIRFWSASGKLGTDTAFSENQLKIGQKLVTKLWNAFRFCKDHIQEYKKLDSTKNVPENVGTVAQWVLHMFSQTVQAYKKQMDDYEYSHALEHIEKFFWHVFCDNYLELIKDQFFNPDKYDNQTLEATRFTLYEIGFGILQLYAPFLPHITETLYQEIFRDQEKAQSVHVTYLDDKRYAYDFTQSVTVTEKILSIVDQVRKLKSENQLSLKTELHELSICSENIELLEKLKQEQALIAGISKAINISFIEKNLDKSCIKQEPENNTWVTHVCV